MKTFTKCCSHGLYFENDCTNNKFSLGGPWRRMACVQHYFDLVAGELLQIEYSDKYFRDFSTSLKCFDLSYFFFFLGFRRNCLPFLAAHATRICQVGLSQTTIEEKEKLKRVKKERNCLKVRRQGRDGSSAQETQRLPKCRRRGGVQIVSSLNHTTSCPTRW